VSSSGLQHYQEFQEILAKYHISKHARQVLSEIKLVLLVAPTSVGKNTIIRNLDSSRYHFVVSDTTRPPRENDGVMELDGREYWFRGEEEVLADLKAGNFLEAELIHRQQVSGISVRELEKARQEGKTAITDVDLEGIHHVMVAKPDTFAIMLLPPSFDEWLRRLASRGKMPAHEQKRRFQTAQRVFEDGLSQNYYHFVISENIGQSVAIIDGIIEGKLNPHQGRAPGLIHNLQESLRQKLDSLDRL
jgi:guanylate kinase